MEWVKLATQFYNDPVFDDLTPNAERLFIRCLAFAGASECGGVLTRKQISRVGILNSTRYVSELIQARLWVQTESGDYRIRSWDSWQESADEQAEHKRKARERKRKQREMSRDQSRDVTPLEKRRAEKNREDTPNGVSSAPPNQDHPLPENWEPSEATIRTLREECGDIVDLRREHQKFTDHYQGNGMVKRDWQAVWRKWMRTAADDARKQPRTRPGRAGGAPQVSTVALRRAEAELLKSNPNPEVVAAGGLEMPRRYADGTPVDPPSFAHNGLRAIQGGKDS